MKAINIISIVLSVLLIPLTVFYMDKVSAARWANWDWASGYSSYSGASYKELTMEASLIVLVFILYFIFVNISNIVKVKTTTSKVMGIIGISLIGLGFLFNLMVMASGGGATFDEVGPAWIIMSLIMIAFSIVYLVQTVKYQSANNKPQTDDIIDDIV